MHRLPTADQSRPGLETANGIGIARAKVAMVVSARFTIDTSRSPVVECIDITPRVREIVRGSRIRAGIACLNTRHTTAALLINEFQDTLIGDFTKLAEQLVPEGGRYRHNDPRYSDCERGNAQGHLRAMLLGRSVTVSVAEGDVALGQHQSIIFAEFDGPRSREVTVQIVGE